MNKEEKAKVLAESEVLARLEITVIKQDKGTVSEITDFEGDTSIMVKTLADSISEFLWKACGEDVEKYPDLAATFGVDIVETCKRKYWEEMAHE